MSLESASFIKALVPTNPEGTDPKSQGDDHLRLLKAVLLSQFGGFTDGVPIRLTENMVNAVGGLVVDGPAINIDNAPPYIAWIPIKTATTGVAPPGFSIGDVLLSIPYSPTLIYQFYVCRSTRLNYRRQNEGGGWNAWECTNPIGVGQVWSGAARAIGTVYSNDTGRPIMVAVSVQGPTNTDTLFDFKINGAIIARSRVVDLNAAGTYSATTATISLIVPAGATYQIAPIGGTPVLISWNELR